MLVGSFEMVLVFGLGYNRCFCGGDFPEPLTLIGVLLRLGYVYDPFFTWAAASLVAMGILLATWAWFRDQWWRRGRFETLCPGCNYDLRGIIETSSYPLTCSECAVTIESPRTLTRPRRAWKYIRLSVLIFVVAHYTARGPDVRIGGWVRIVPSTVLVLQPMDVVSWIENRLGPGRLPVPGSTPESELDRRLRIGALWSWQEWILFKRIERVCLARDDYGISSAQYETADILRSTSADATRQETTADRLAGLAGTADVTFLIDWASLEAAELRADDFVQPVDPYASIAAALDELCNEPWPGYAYWDIAPDGVVVGGPSRPQTTIRSRIYDISALVINRGHGLALMDLLTEDQWINNAAFMVAGRLVVVASTKGHIEFERLLVNLQKASEAEPPFMRPCRMLGNPRSVDLESEYFLGALDYFRVARSVSIESLRSAGPTFRDGVTPDELDACGRAAFGLLDTVRSSLHRDLDVVLGRTAARDVVAGVGVP